MFNIKKIIVGAFVIGITGVLVFGAINRTQAKTVDNSFSAQNHSGNQQQQTLAQSSGRGRSETNEHSSDHQELSHSNVSHDQSGNGNQSIQRNETDLDYRQSGNQSNSTSGSENRRGQQNGGSNSIASNGNQQNLAEEQFNETVIFQGIIQSIDDEEMLVSTTDGNEILIEGRALSFAYEQNFQANIQDQVALQGFFENNDFEVITIENLSSGQTITLREESGRPLWAGGAGRN